MTRMDCETFDLDVVDLLYEDGSDDAPLALRFTEWSGPVDQKSWP